MDAYTRSLQNQKIKEADLVRLTNEVEEATREPFRQMLSALDDISADRFGIPKEEARQSWFQSSYGKYTNMGNIQRLIHFDPDMYFEGLDVEDALLRTAEAQGQRPMMQAILDRSFYHRDGEKRSSLYFDKTRNQGKDQGAFMTSGAHPPDTVRVFSSINPSLMESMYDAMRTALHETPGHGFDFSVFEKRLAKLLRDHHSTTTESHAFLHETLITDRKWLLTVPHKIDGTPLFDEKKADEYLAKTLPLTQLSELSGVRSTMALMEFERLAYHHLYKENKKTGPEAKNPKKLVQDLNDIWWTTRERFMMEKRPAGADAQKSGWAWLPHYIFSTAYYPNYFQADVLRPMKTRYIDKNFGTLLSEKARKWLNNSLKTGTLHNWDKIIETMLGERLNAAALKEECAKIQIPQCKRSA
jgi:oligoendopeptidase F